MIKKVLFLLIFGIPFIEYSSTNVSKYKSSINTSELLQKEDFNCEKCNIVYVREIKLNMDNLDTLDIMNFLCTIDESCKNNVEFSQFSNKILFMLLLNYPDLTIELLAKYDFQFEYICNMLGRPINDGIDVEGVASLLKKKNTYQQIRERLLQSLPGY